MKVLVACEFSGIVREAFAKLGHDAWTCAGRFPSATAKADELDYTPVFQNFITAHKEIMERNYQSSVSNWGVTVVKLFVSPKNAECSLDKK